MSIAARFALAMTLALAVVMFLAGTMLFDKTARVVESSVDQSLAAATSVLGDTAQAKEDGTELYEQTSSGARPVGRATRFDVKILQGEYKGGTGHLYQEGPDNSLLVPDTGNNPRKDLYGLFLVVTAAVVSVGAVVSAMIAMQISKPLNVLVNDVRAIARGNLHHRTNTKGSGEVRGLAQAIDKMAHTLQGAQDAEIEFGVREREREVAMQVAESLLPEDTPTLPGYSVAMAHVGSDEPGGDFHDYQEMDNGRLALFVCDVSGKGVPGAIVGATARAYLKSELEQFSDAEQSLKRVNRAVARDVRRGMFVTALGMVIDSKEHVATVACAGHKLPLVRWDAAAGQVKLIQPGGIALGFDKGPVFDRSLELIRAPLEPGDRLLIAGTGAVQVQNPEGEELGEKALYRAFARHAKKEPKEIMERLLIALENHAGETPFPADVSIIILSRDNV